MVATARIDLRMEEETKQMIERGAALAGVPVAAFVKMSASRCASEIIAANTLVLNPEDSAWFVDLLNQPPSQPTSAMLQAVRRRRELLGG